MLPDCSKFPKRNVQMYCTSSTTQAAQILVRHRRSNGSSSTKFSRTSRQFEEVLLELGWEKVPNLECLFVHRKQGLSLSVHMDDNKMTGKKLNMAPMWKKWVKHVDLDEPISFLDHVYLGCTQRECKPNEIIVDEYK